jgi:hypothetical protein
MFAAVEDVREQWARRTSDTDHIRGFFQTPALFTSRPQLVVYSGKVAASCGLAASSPVGVVLRLAAVSNRCFVMIAAVNDATGRRCFVLPQESTEQLQKELSEKLGQPLPAAVLQEQFSDVQQVQLDTPQAYYQALNANSRANRAQKKQVSPGPGAGDVLVQLTHQPCPAACHAAGWRQLLRLG